MAAHYLGLQIIDISNPANPTFKGSYDTPGWAYGVALFKNYAYMADGESGLQIIDISDPSNSTFRGSYDTPSYAFGVAISSNYAYVADSLSGLQIIALNLDKLILSGTPSSVGTYNVDIKACNEAKECTTDSFDIVITDSSDTDDTIDLTTTLIIIGSSTVGAICIGSFFCALIVGSGMVMLKRRRNKIFKDESNNTRAQEQKKEDELQKSEFTMPNNDTQGVVENEPVVQQEKSKVLECDLDSDGEKERRVPEYKGDIELDVMPNFVKDRISVKPKIEPLN